MLPEGPIGTFSLKKIHLSPLPGIMRSAKPSDPHRLITALIFFSIFVFFHMTADGRELSSTSSCFIEARSWISELPSGKRDILHNHARESCALSLNWLKDHGESKEDTSLERVCTNLVLIWTHQKCIYFRRYFSPDVYEPCEMWARSQYKHCINQDMDWFEGAKKNEQLNQE